MKDISPVLITGAAGFIGSSLCIKLINNGIEVVGLDCVNNYYDVNLKRSRLENINKKAREKIFWSFYEVNLKDIDELKKYLKDINLKL